MDDDKPERRAAVTHAAFSLVRLRLGSDRTGKPDHHDLPAITTETVVIAQNIIDRSQCRLVSGG